MPTRSQQCQKTVDLCESEKTYGKRDIGPHARTWQHCRVRYGIATAICGMTTGNLPSTQITCRHYACRASSVSR